MNNDNLLTMLERGVVLADGAMGTYYQALTNRASSGCERANLETPRIIQRIHREYLDAGARLLRTNTYAATGGSLGMNAEGQRKVLIAGWENAQAAVRQFREDTGSVEPIAVGADLGSLSEFTKNEDLAELDEMIDVWLSLGARTFVFETLESDSMMLKAAALVRAKAPDAVIMATFAVQPEGFTATGISIRTLFEELDQALEPDVFGLNCVSGPTHMLNLIQSVPTPRKPLAVLPNAGYPTVINREIYFPNTPDYFAGQVSKIIEAGARLVGGCCGTSPGDIRAVDDLLKKQQRERAVSDALSVPAREAPVVPEIRILSDRSTERKAAPSVEIGQTKQLDHSDEAAALAGSGNPLLDKFNAGETVFAVEYDSPETAHIDDYLKGALAIEAAGADAITIADCPVARPRVDSSLMACKLRKVLKKAVPVPHLTCRDRNLNATKALLLGLSVEDVRNIIIVTGDPIPRAERDEVKAVFNFNSVNLAKFITNLNQEVFPKPLSIAGAFNINAQSFEAELSKAKRKIENGISIFYTQPVLSERAVRRMAKLRSVLPPEIKIMGGILPVVSYRNAQYMQNELSGIVLDPELIARYEGLNREQGEEVALEVSVQAGEAIADSVSGFYLITPFNRVELVKRILGELKKL